MNENWLKGKQIFEERLDYPLPKKEGVRDYVFFIFPSDDDYSKAAKHFFSVFYRDHRQNNAKSLEQVIDFLFEEITKKDVKILREIAIVCHGNPFSLQIPLLQHAPPAMRRLDAHSLAVLQEAMLKGEHSPFQQKRKKVISCLGEGSWVVIRACNFGHAKEGMFAFFAFWGGKANVYAPMAYQNFSEQRVGGQGEYFFRERSDVLDHLVKQRFISHKRSQKGKDAALGKFLNKKILKNKEDKEELSELCQVQVFLNENANHEFNKRDPQALISFYEKWEGGIWLLADTISEEEGGSSNLEEFKKYEDFIQDWPGSMGIEILAPSKLKEELSDSYSIDLSPNAKISFVALEGDLRRWKVIDSGNDLNLEEMRTHAWRNVFKKKIYLGRPFLKEGEEGEYKRFVAMKEGVHPNSPGVELIAYFNRYPTEDLLYVLDYLRDTYSKDNALYIQYVIEAITKDPLFLGRCAGASEVDLFKQPLWSISEYPVQLTQQEVVDLSSFYRYPYEWREVKVSNPPKKEFQEDLFLEHTLKKDHLLPILPYEAVTISELISATETNPQDLYDKESFVIDRRHFLRDISCEKFEKILMELAKSGFLDNIDVENQNSNKRRETFLHNLMELDLFSGSSLLNSIKDAYEIYDLLDDYYGFVSTNEIVSSGWKWQVARAFVGNSLASILTTLDGMLALPLLMFEKWIKEFAEFKEREIRRGLMLGLWEGALVLKKLSGKKQVGNRVPDLKPLADPLGKVDRKWDVSMQKNLLFTFPDEAERSFNSGLNIIREKANEALINVERIMDGDLRRRGLDACKIRVLKRSGLIRELDSFRNGLIHEMAQGLLREIHLLK